LETGHYGHGCMAGDGAGFVVTEAVIKTS
jgi:hypothetical protein